jgi:hypothetical protein
MRGSVRFGGFEVVVVVVVVVSRCVAIACASRSL